MQRKVNLKGKSQLTMIICRISTIYGLEYMTLSILTADDSGQVVLLFTNRLRSADGYENNRTIPCVIYQFSKTPELMVIHYTSLYTV